MARSLANFLGKLSQNSIRTTNMFEIEIHPPMGAGIGNELDDITFYGTGFQAPNRETQYIDVAFKGYPIPIATLPRMEQDHTITVNADIDGKIRNAFLKWQSYCINSDIESVFDGHRNPEKESTIVLNLFGSDNSTVVETITLYYVRINTVSGLNMSNSDAAAATFDVSFKSIYWRSSNE